VTRDALLSLPADSTLAARQRVCAEGMDGGGGEWETVTPASRAREGCGGGGGARGYRGGGSSYRGGRGGSFRPRTEGDGEFGGAARWRASQEAGGRGTGSSADEAGATTAAVQPQAAGACAARVRVGGSSGAANAAS